MANAITVTNNEYTILAAVKTALGAAQISSVGVFKSVTVASSEEQAREAQFKGSQPAVIILVGSPSEVRIVEADRGCILPLTLLVTAKTNSGVDETTRIQEALRLMNAAKNAVEIALPAAATGFGDEQEFHPKGAVWGDMTFDDSAKQPWVAFRLPVSFAFGLSTTTGH